MQAEGEVLRDLRPQQNGWTNNAGLFRKHLQFVTNQLIELYTAPIRSQQSTISASKCLYSRPKGFFALVIRKTVASDRLNDGQQVVTAMLKFTQNGLARLL